MHHQVFELKLHLKPFSQEHIYLRVTHCCPPTPTYQKLFAWNGMPCTPLGMPSRMDPLSYLFDVKNIIKWLDKYSSFRFPYMCLFVCVHTCAYAYVYKGTICDWHCSWENNLWFFLNVVCEFGDVFLYLLPVFAKSKVNIEVWKFS